MADVRLIKSIYTGTKVDIGELTPSDTAVIPGSMEVLGGTSLNAINVTGGTSLNSLEVFGGTSLNTLDVSGGTSLSALYVLGGTSLNNVNVSGGTSVNTFVATGGTSLFGMLNVIGGVSGITQLNIVEIQIFGG